ncbi:hypothetical protein ACE7GA_19170 [Roseomonas sp. CCTCC AB2023176]|uniref:hypothetical protein n=1 Tax=Roseomonas sp. CCTCC AB2023176 TaxID=3342640 RepID=UPI0035D6BFFB
MRIETLTPTTEARLGMALGGWAVSLDQRVLGLGDTQIEAMRDARETCRGPVPADAVLSRITEAAQSRVMDWGAAVASLRAVGAILCTRAEGVAMNVVHDWFDRRAA